MASQPTKQYSSHNCASAFSIMVTTEEFLFSLQQQTGLQYFNVANV